VGRIGFGELVVILIIALLVFGPSKLPEMGKAVGNAMREFRNAAKGIADDSPADISNKE
jgi:sec-independent protein translocase protein TatA